MADIGHGSRTSGILWLVGLVIALLAFFIGIPLWMSALVFAVFAIVIRLPFLFDLAVGGLIGCVVVFVAQWMGSFLGLL